MLRDKTPRQIGRLMHTCRTGLCAEWQRHAFAGSRLHWSLCTATGCATRCLDWIEDVRRSRQGLSGAEEWGGGGELDMSEACQPRRRAVCHRQKIAGSPCAPQAFGMGGGLSPKGPAP